MRKFVVDVRNFIPFLRFPLLMCDLLFEPCVPVSELLDLLIDLL